VSNPNEEIRAANQQAIRITAEKSIYKPPGLIRYGAVAAITGSAAICSGGDKTNAAWGMIDKKTGKCKV